jgi:hypothetical protein
MKMDDNETVSGSDDDMSPEEAQAKRAEAAREGLTRADTIDSTGTSLNPAPIEETPYEAQPEPRTDRDIRDGTFGAVLPPLDEETVDGDGDVPETEDTIDG